MKRLPEQKIEELAKVVFINVSQNGNSFESLLKEQKDMYKRIAAAVAVHLGHEVEFRPDWMPRF